MANNGHNPSTSSGRTGSGSSERDLIFDWNVGIPAHPFIGHPFELNDESLRDGVQSPSVIDPQVEAKLEIVELMESLGIQRVDIGLPGAGKRAYEAVTRIATHIRDRKMKIKPNCAARTVVADIAPVAEIQQKVGIPLASYTFIGSSPIRQLAENWDLDHLLATSSAAIDFCVKEGIENAFVTEDTTRSNPKTLDRLFRNAIDHGTKALVLCDTVGHAAPEGATRLVKWTRGLIQGMGASVRVEWHGHNDRGLAVINSLAALKAGANVVHGCALGIGERVGNAAMDQLLLNLKLMGLYAHDLSNLTRYVSTVSAAVGVPVPKNYPLCGEDAFRTATGVHASAIVKAQKMGDTWLEDRVYSGVPAGEFGRHQTLEVGHMSGMSNVHRWLSDRNITADEATARAILDKAKLSDRVLTEAEILEVIRTAPSAARA